jgi:hypothetical protein
MRGNPVPAGARAAKIYLTSLYNRAQPLIRPEIGQPSADRGRKGGGIERFAVHGKTIAAPSSRDGDSAR